MSSYFELLYFPKKVRRVYSMDTLDALVLGASFCIQRIKLALKLKELYLKWRWSRPFSSKKSPHIFSETNPSNFIICQFKHFNNFFLYKTQKQRIISLPSQFQLYFTFYANLFSLALIRTYQYNLTCP